MLTSLRIPMAATVAAFGLVALGATMESASACDGANVGCVDNPGNGTVTVSVTGSLVRGGSPGSGGGSTTVSVPVPCYRTPLWTGKEYFDGIKDGTITGAGWDEWNPEPWAPYAGYKQHKNDTEGRWYVPTCTMLDSFENFQEFDKFSLNYFLNNTGVYVEAGEQPPVPPVPPEVLLKAATDSMTMPEPAFDYNPDITGNLDTLVNLDTWFWLRDPTGSGYVAATAGNNSVRVDATLDRVAFSAGRAGSVACDDTGTAWAPGASSTCTLAFQRPGEHQVTAETEWGLTWSFNGQARGAIDPVGAVWSDVLVVAQSQSLVTEVD
ncbi:hypothetical protein [Nocardioides sp. Root140]|uniref:hypothetical protein n=1 Tax=Nocardioides sp. Root140 TaxID=1736460 RepID=UPI000AC03F0F|nr:hypothetical protein [Nocardioides sp. Root140]